MEVKEGKNIPYRGGHGEVRDEALVFVSGRSDGSGRTGLVSGEGW